MSQPIRFPFIKSTHLECNFYFRDFINWFYRNVDYKRMHDCVLENFLKLKITLIEILEILIEIEARKNLRRGSFFDFFIDIEIFLFFNMMFKINDLYALLVASSFQFKDFFSKVVNLITLLIKVVMVVSTLNLLIFLIIDTLIFF
jgi:hypothetical protein